jgi:hypothetical protein
VSHNHTPWQLLYPPADFLPRSGLVQYLFNGQTRNYYNRSLLGLTQSNKR